MVAHELVAFEGSVHLEGIVLSIVNPFAAENPAGALKSDRMCTVLAQSDDVTDLGAQANGRVAQEQHAD